MTGQAMGSLSSLPCRYCGSRLVVPPGETRESWRDHHESRCALSVDCPHCAANIGQRCKAPNGRTVRHASREASA